MVKFNRRKRLYRSRKERSIAGVCGGIAEYLDVDPTLVRIVWLLAAAAGGPGIPALLRDGSRRAGRARIPASHSREAQTRRNGLSRQLQQVSDCLAFGKQLRFRRLDFAARIVAQVQVRHNIHSAPPVRPQRK